MLPSGFKVPAGVKARGPLPVATPLAIAFEALFVSITAMLLWAYVSFVRMNPEIRRARLFLMARRIHRFLLAFTIAFLAIVLSFLPGLFGVVVPAVASGLAVFVFMGGILYGALEIFFIVNPVSFRRAANGRSEV
jgi:hypothetical protein